MRIGITLLAALCAAVAAGDLLAATSPDAAGTRQLERRIDRNVQATRYCQRELGDVPVSPTRRAYRAGRSTVAFQEWALGLWQARHRRYCGLRNRLERYPPNAIRYVFRRLGQDDVAIAVDVSDDEGGGPFCTRASNGQYQGCFQMGGWARSTYGHARTALGQAWAAFRYRVAAKGWCSGWSATANVCPGAIP